jgi:hypothetical protein
MITSLGNNSCKIRYSFRTLGKDDCWVWDLKETIKGYKIDPSAKQIVEDIKKAFTTFIQKGAIEDKHDGVYVAILLKVAK